MVGGAFLKAVLDGIKAEVEAQKRTPAKIEYSEPVTLPNGNTVHGTIRNGTLVLIVITDKKGNTLEVEPELYDTNQLKLKKNIKIPTYD